MENEERVIWPKASPPVPDFEEERLKAYSEAVTEFLDTYPGTKPLNLTTADFPIETTVKTWLDKTEFVKFYRSLYDRRREVAADWSAALTSFIENTKRRVEAEFIDSNLVPKVLDNLFKVSFIKAQIGQWEMVPYHTAWQKDYRGIEIYPFAWYHIQSVLEGAAMAFLLPELEQELLEMSNTTIENKAMEEMNKTAKPFNMPSAASPIQWMGANTQFAYLMQALQKEGFLPRGIDLWATVMPHFLNKNGKPMANLSQSSNNAASVNTNAKPRGASALDRILDNLSKLPPDPEEEY